MTANVTCDSAHITSHHITGFVRKMRFGCNLTDVTINSCYLFNVGDTNCTELVYLYICVFLVYVNENE
jgi:hypothetical protein